MELNSHIVKLQKDTEVHFKDTSKKKSNKSKVFIALFHNYCNRPIKIFLRCHELLADNRTKVTGGKAKLHKSILHEFIGLTQSLPCYFCNCFLLPNDLVKHI